MNEDFVNKYVDALSNELTKATREKILIQTHLAMANEKMAAMEATANAKYENYELVIREKDQVISEKQIEIEKLLQKIEKLSNLNKAK